MTRPRKRPKPGRYWVVTYDDGRPFDCFSTRENAKREAEYSGSGIVECAPMPRVRVAWYGDAYGDELYEVTINGVSITVQPIQEAKKLARDLRRALRGK